MCLYVNKIATADLKKRGSALITCYKVFCFRGKSYSSPYRFTVVNLNTNCLSVDNTAKKPRSYIKSYGYWSGGERVEEGIHAFRSKVSARGRAVTGRKVFVKCYGYKEDLIAVGDNDIAFTRLYIDEKDYQKMLDNVYGKNKYTHADV